MENKTQPGIDHPPEAAGTNGRDTPSAHAPNVPLVLLTVFAAIFLLDWAQAVFIPLVLSATISYALSPLVQVLRRWRVPPSIGAALLLATIVGVGGSMAYSLKDEAVGIIRALPQAAEKLRETVSREWGGREDGTLRDMEKAAAQIERAAREAGASPSVPKGVTRVRIEEQRFNIRDYLWDGTMSALSFVSLAVMVLFLTYFMLISGDMFRRKLVLIAPTFGRKKITLQVLNEIGDQIQRYLLVQVFAGALVGVVTWLAFRWIGLEHAALWGVVAGVLNAIPYLGAILVTIATALVALLQFGSISMTLSVGALSLAINSLEGYLLMPWLMGRANRMNAVVIFVGVLFWGWLWGPWGLLLGMPVMIAIKSICDHIEAFRVVGDLMSD